MRYLLILIAIIMCMFLCKSIAIAEDILRPKLVKLANEELTSKGKK
ncbi:MAG TPA: hypothetical protein PLC16_11020 [Defluviitaleaceae bacterium]|nr:hypothetical protein [Defluviitaleaceae bacterium]